MSKYALIHWTNSNGTSIVPCSSVINKDLLQNSGKIGKIIAAVLGKKEPANGWQMHDGRVICTHDKLSFLKKKEEAFIHEESDSEPEVGRGHRQPKRKIFPGEEVDSESDSSEGYDNPETSKMGPTKAKKVKRSQQANAEDIIQRMKIQQLTSPISQQPQLDSCQDCARLMDEVKQLKLANAALCKGLPGVVTDLTDLVQTIRSASGGQPLQRPKVTSPSPSPSPLARSTSASPSSEVNSTLQQDGPAEYELGYGVVLPVWVVNRCKKNDFKRLTRDLMCALFTQEEMSLCSVFGKKGVGAGRELRQPLHGDKVKAIMEYVKKHFPSVEMSQISQTMAYKLKDVRTSSAKSHNA